MRHHVLLAFGLLLAACSGGAGGTAAPSSPAPAVRPAPGLTVSVSPESGGLAIAIASDPGEPEPTSVETWPASAWDEPATPVAASRGGDGRWHAAVAAPSAPPAGCSWLVRVARADGSLIEVGLGDFPVR